MVSSRGSNRSWLLIGAAGLVAIVLCAGSSLEKAPAGNPPAHGAKGEHEANGKPEEKAGNPKTTPAPLQPKPSAKAAANGASGDHPAKHEEEGPKWTDKVNAVSSVIMLLFTAMLTVVAFMQNRLETKLAADTADSLNISRQSADAATAAAKATADAIKAFKQADAGILAFTHSKVTESDGENLVTIGFANAGRTPVILRYWDVYTEHVTYSNDPLIVPTELTLNFNDAPNVIRADDPLIVGKLRIRTEPDKSTVIVGGAIFTDVFGEFKLLSVAMTVAGHDLIPLRNADFRLWEEKMAAMERAEKHPDGEA